jgi:hypothetical protein
LGKIGPEARSATPALAQALNDRNLSLRQAAIALFKIGLTEGDLKNQATAILVDALSAERKPDERTGAALALQEIEPPLTAAMPALISAAAKENPEELRKVALTALEKIDPAAAKSLAR